MQPIRLVTFALLFCGLAVHGVGALGKGDVEARLIHKKLYDKAEADIQYGSGARRLRAAMFLGARRNPRYVRIIGRQLLSELDVKSPYLRLTRNDPAIKSTMAWALGNIGHEKGVQYLLKALPKMQEILDEQRRQIRAAQQKEVERYRKARAGRRKYQSINDDAIMRIILDQDRPGPYQKNRKHSLPYSPDVYWSISDEFKGFMAPDMRDEGMRMRMRGYNWVNLAFRIFDAIGEIYVNHIRKDTINPDVVTAVGAYLDPKHPPFMRGAAAVCLGKIGSPKAMEMMLRAYGKEKDYEVRARLAFGMLRNDRGRTKIYLDLLKYLEDDRRHVRFVAVLAFRELRMGEAIVPLQAALKVENIELIRKLLEQAIENARIDNLKLPG